MGFKMKKENTKKIFFCLFMTILLVGIISAADVSYCCEKTIEGAWCMNWLKISRRI